MKTIEQASKKLFEDLENAHNDIVTILQNDKPLNPNWKKIKDAKEKYLICTERIMNFYEAVSSFFKEEEE